MNSFNSILSRMKSDQARKKRRWDISGRIAREEKGPLRDPWRTDAMPHTRVNNRPRHLRCPDTRPSLEQIQHTRERAQGIATGGDTKEDCVLDGELNWRREAHTQMSVKLPESMGQTDLAAAVLVNAVCGGDEVRPPCHACVCPDPRSRSEV